MHIIVCSINYIILSSVHGFFYNNRAKIYGERHMLVYYLYLFSTHIV